MDNWIAITIIVIALVLIIGNFSTFQKSAKTKLRKTSLNDLQETLPRTQKKPHKMPPVASAHLSKHQSSKTKNSD